MKQIQLSVSTSMAIGQFTLIIEKLSTNFIQTFLLRSIS